MAESTIKKERNICAIGENGEALGAVASFTPTIDCWARISTRTASTTPSAEPVIRISQNGNVIYEYTGGKISNSANYVCFPVYAGKTYSIDTYRTTITGVDLYH